MVPLSTCDKKFGSVKNKIGEGFKTYEFDQIAELKKDELEEDKKITKKFNNEMDQVKSRMESADQKKIWILFCFASK